MERDEIQCFERTAEWDVVTRALPHWSQPAAVTFVTWRLGDSLPRETLRRIDREIEARVAGEGLDAHDHWRQKLERASPIIRSSLCWSLFKTRDKYLDQGIGGCQLASDEFAALVIDSLQRFDGDRYVLTDAVVLPNHVHFLCAFSKSTDMLKQCWEWKRFTAKRINAAIGRRGLLWQKDQFDHLVRSEEQFQYLRRYVFENLAKVGLQPDPCRYYQLKLDP